MRSHRTISLGETFRLAFAELRRQRLRSLLTGMSMMIAVASLIIVVTVALTGREFVVAQIEGVGSNLIYAYYEAGGNVSAAEADYIDLADIDAVRDRLAGLIEAAAGVMSTWDSVSIDGRQRQIRVLGSTAEYRDVRNLQVLAGRFLDSGDLATRSKVCLLTPETAEQLYGSSEAAIGETLKVHDLDFQVVGVFHEGVETFGQSEVAANSVLIPITVMRYFQQVERVDPLYVSVRSQDQVEKAAALVRETLESRHRPGSLYRVDNLAGILTAAKQISSALTVVMILVAAITLAISGIFIMNILLISVSERTSEIGLRMAVGATRRDIRRQFLIEAIALSLIGGLCGALLGVAAPLLAAWLWPHLPIQISPVSVAAAIVVAATVGGAFGLLPAARASKLDPVEALRHD